MANDAMGYRDALVCGEQRLTFADLDQAARCVAGKVEPGIKLAYLAENSPTMPAALFGAALCGTPFVPLNYRLPAEQLHALMQTILPALLMTEQEGYADILPHVSLEEAITGAPVDGEAPDEEGGIAIELFTSGTSGMPKSAILRHDNLMSYILSTVEFMSAGEEEATLISVPPYHIAGISAILSSTYAGRRMVQLPNFSPEAWVEAAKKERVTHAFVVPTMLQRIIECDTELTLPSLKYLAYGGGKMPVSVIERAMEIWPDVQFTNAYGLTETSSTICLLGPDDHRFAFESSDPLVRRRLGSVGRAIPSVELQVRNDSGQACQTEEVGLVFVRGDQVSGEYKGSGSELDEEGWFPTMDRGFVDAAGYLFLDGRADDVIVRGGENISPGEIEDVILGHEAVRDVAAIAVPDEEWGEAVGVAIVCGEEVTDLEICTLVRQTLRSSRVPSVIKRYDELPYNETGKLLRRIIRDQFTN